MIQLFSGIGEILIFVKLRSTDISHARQRSIKLVSALAYSKCSHFLIFSFSHFLIFEKDGMVFKKIFAYCLSVKEKVVSLPRKQ